MKITKQIISVPLLICLTLFLYSKEPVNYTQSNSIAKLGYKSFAEEKYDEAISFYNKVESYVAEHKEYFDHHYRNFSIIDLIKKRKRAELLP